MNKKLLSLAALMATLHATAQDSTTVRKQMDEVVVTATKYARKASETGKVITVIDRQTLDRSIGKDVAQLLTEQAGIVVNGATSNMGKDKSLFMRGASNDYTVILINGIPVNDPTGLGGGAFDLRTFPIEQIERIEILKGAQSTLYGSNAVAGVINIITRKHGNKPAELYGSVAAGSFGTFRANAGMAGGVEKLQYNIGFTHNETKGISEALDTTGKGNFDKDGLLQNAINVQLDGEVLTNLHVKPFFRYAFIRGDYDKGAFADNQFIYRHSLLTAGTQVNYKYNKGQITAQFQHDDIKRNGSNYGYEGQTQFAEIYAEQELTPQVSILEGFDFREHKMISNATIKVDPSIQMYSPYLSVFVKNISGFYLEAGGRLNNHSKYGNNFTFSANPSYLIRKDLKVFANVASAYKAPTLSYLYESWGNPELKPEKSFTYEGGVQASLLNNMIEIRAVYFNREVTDMISSGPDYKLTNYDKQKDQGVEIEPTINITKDLQVKLFYSYVDGKLTTRNPEGKDSTSNMLIRKPKHSAGISVGYQITKNLFVSTNAYTYGRRNDFYFDPNTFERSNVSLSSYTLWNAYAEYKLVNNRIRIFADLKNITNAKYQEVYGYGTMGTNITAGVAVRL